MNKLKEQSPKSYRSAQSFTFFKNILHAGLVSTYSSQVQIYSIKSQLSMCYDEIFIQHTLEQQLCANQCISCNVYKDI